MSHERRRIIHFNVTDSPSGMGKVLTFPKVGGLHHTVGGWQHEAGEGAKTAQIGFERDSPLGCGFLKSGGPWAQAMSVPSLRGPFSRCISPSPAKTRAVEPSLDDVLRPGRVLWDHREYAIRQMVAPKFPGIRVVANGNELVSYHTEARVVDGGIFFPITPSTEMGELFQLSFAQGRLNVFGDSTIAIETEGEHAAQGGAIAYSVTGKRAVNFTSGQGLVYGLEQYYHAPGKLSTMIVQLGCRALTKHALNVHCGHDDLYAALDTGWIILMAKGAQQAADQSLILRRVAELALTPGINAQDGFLTSHLERTFFKHEAELIREFLGRPDDTVDCPTAAQRELFGPQRRRIPCVVNLHNPAVLGPVQNQEHYMNGVIARRNNFCEEILPFLEDAYREFGELTGRYYGPVTEHRTDDAETVFFSLGSAAENIDAAVDHLRATRNAKVGSIHLNIVRPFPEAAIAKALAGRKNVIVLERTDEALSADNPMTREIRGVLGRAVEHHTTGIDNGIPAIAGDQVPRIFRGSYGLGSRDFRPEGIIGAWEYANGLTTRTDGASAASGETYFTVGIKHPYSVRSEETPSLLPEKAIAVRLHSIGGWGMITTGKNLGAIIGALGEDLSARDGSTDEFGRPQEKLHVSANPRYGSEKKGAPTAYFMVVAPERIRVNCDLRHVDVVLCCDPKAFLHSNPLEGIKPGGIFVWESNKTPASAWTRIPPRLRQRIIDDRIQLYTLPGFDIARDATPRPDLQLRMQGNAFLGAFFAVSTFLDDNSIPLERFREVVRAQYQSKFGRFGDEVVESNMQVMLQGANQIQKVPIGDLAAADRSSMQKGALLPRSPRGELPLPEKQWRLNLKSRSYFDAEFRAGLGYDQPASPFSAVGIIPAATGASASKYVARRETPVFIAENCTQCMNCIAACPDTALPNTAQDVSTILRTTFENYVSDHGDRKLLNDSFSRIEATVRGAMVIEVKEKRKTAFTDLTCHALGEVEGLSDRSKNEVERVLRHVPIAYNKVNAIFSGPERKKPGSGGVFTITVSDRCKGCAECVTECGDHDALRMVTDSEEVNAGVATASAFVGLLEDTAPKHLGKYVAGDPMGSRQATLRSHLMVRRNYEALVSGDGACAGCGEKSILRALATVTEAYMRPIYHAKAERVEAVAARLEESGAGRLAELEERAPKEYELFKRAVAHVVMGLGGENDDDTEMRIAAAPELDNAGIVGALVAVLRQDAFNHKHLQAVDGGLANGMSVMAMGASTGCNSVFGSTPPNNPHPYPWMNSLFQDGPTITWMFSESFIVDHARRSVIPEILSTALLERSEDVMTDAEFFELTHYGDALMTDLQIDELPKAWYVGGDGATGDIGFQNTSKVVLQNRPNVKMLMLDTQVYSNTGGQNSDSTPLLGGSDMNQIGAATQGKLTEKKSVAEIFTVGHGSPFVAQVSMADAPKLFRAILEGLAYRGTAFLQCFTTCQPEHGVGDSMSTVQAKRIRDSRGMPEFVFDPSLGETCSEALSLKGNPLVARDWAEVKVGKGGPKIRYTVAHWAATEARFRRHLKKVDTEATAAMMHLEDMLVCIKQADVVRRRYLQPGALAFVPDYGVYIEVEGTSGTLVPMALSRQLVLFCVERRKAWRMLQSRAGIASTDYVAQCSLLNKFKEGELTAEVLRSSGAELLDLERAALAKGKSI